MHLWLTLPLHINHNLDRALVLQVMQLVSRQHVLELEGMRDHAGGVDGEEIVVKRESFRLEQIVLVLCQADKARHDGGAHVEFARRPSENVQ